VDGVEILVRMMDGEFPPYQKIIPASYETQIEFSGEEFSQKLKTAMIFARESSGIIRLLIQPEQHQLKIISSSTAIGSQESTVPMKTTSSGEKEIAFNIKYLSDFLSIVKPENIWLGMNEMLKPALFRPLGEEKYRYIIMPFRVNQ
jgi:DNA polymerase-3 subunit beta